MRIGLIYGPWCLTDKRFRLYDVWNDPQGLTGSELSYLKVAREMASRGHEVSLFTLADGPVSWDGISVFPFESRASRGLDVAISWNESEPLRSLRPDVLRLVSWQLNKFDHCAPDSDSFVDCWLSPSEHHMRKMVSEGLPIGSCYGPSVPYFPDPSRWAVVPHGCEPQNYAGTPKVAGRVIWGSSPDRGLHWLLQEWPKIRLAVPRATLKIFYSIDRWLSHLLGPSVTPDSHPEILEQRRRAEYIRDAIPVLMAHGVEVVGSVSRKTIDAEMASAEVLAYPCDPVCWSEGFSVTLLEGCAARACPVTTTVDALGSVYAGVLPMVAPVREGTISAFSDTVIRALMDSGFRDEVNSRASAFAARHSWGHVANAVEDAIRARRPNLT